MLRMSFRLAPREGNSGTVKIGSSIFQQDVRPAANLRASSRFQPFLLCRTVTYATSEYRHWLNLCTRLPLVLHSPPPLLSSLLSAVLPDYLFIYSSRRFLLATVVAGYHLE
jgi:hypothetical protein